MVVCLSKVAPKGAGTPLADASAPTNARQLGHLALGFFARILSSRGSADGE
jgi:hypothetical protein